MPTRPVGPGAGLTNRTIHPRSDSTYCHGPGVMAKPTVQPEAASFDTYRLGVRGMCFTVSTDPRSGDWPRHRARSNPWRISYEPRVLAAQESLWPYLGLRRADRY